MSNFWHALSGLTVTVFSFSVAYTLVGFAVSRAFKRRTAELRARLDAVDAAIESDAIRIDELSRESEELGLAIAEIDRERASIESELEEVGDDEERKRVLVARFKAFDFQRKFDEVEAADIAAREKGSALLADALKAQAELAKLRSEWSKRRGFFQLLSFLADTEIPVGRSDQ